MHRGNACGCHARFRLRPSGALPVSFGFVFYAVVDFAAEHGLRVLDYVFMTEDAKEGPRAFAEKRQPKWSGR